MTDLLIALGSIAILSMLVLAGISQTRASATSLQCLANLRSIGTGLTAYAMDNSMRYPAPSAVGKSWESLIRRYAGQSMVFACPADQEVFPTVGSSYDWRDTPSELTTLEGKAIGRNYRANAVLALETLPGWHKEHQINALLLDGAAVTMVDEDCLKDLEISVYSSAAR
jgi:hypothetical protein